MRNPTFFNHNVETVKRLQRKVRIQARWERSVAMLRHAKKRGFITKTSLMLGVGETKEEIRESLEELRKDDVNILTLGQYLQPSPKHLPIDRWVTPEEFAVWKEIGLELGFGVVESGPLVRSSYRADSQSAKYSFRPQPVATAWPAQVRNSKTSDSNPFSKLSSSRGGNRLR